MSTTARTRPTAVSSIEHGAFTEAVLDYAIFMIDATGHVETWNAGAERIKGYRPDEIIGKHIRSFYPPEDVVAGKPEKLLQIAREQGRVEDEGWRVRKDGTRFWADVVLTALRDHDGNLRGFAKVTRDLTDRRRTEEQLRQSEERFRALVESVEDYAIFMLDTEGLVATWNRGAQRISGFTSGEVIGRHFSLFCPPEEIAKGKPAKELELATRDGRYEEEGWRVRKDGTRFWANVVLTAMYDLEHRLIGFSKVTRDLSERRGAQLERESLLKAEEAVRLRDEFLSIASHELKTPLTSLILQLQSLKKTSPLDAPTVAKLERALRSTDRLGALVETLLDVSRIASGRFELHPEKVDVAALVEDLAERTRPQLIQAGCKLTLALERGVEAQWDPLRVEQLLSNLLANASKYSAGAEVEVELTRDGEQAVIQVRDRGPGIPEEALRRIFGRFERAASMQHFGGLGLGLYVAQEIAVAHGGTISASNRAGGGACLVVRLPLHLPSVASKLPVAS